MAGLAHSASESYVKSGFSNKMGWGSRPALLMVDVCAAYWSEESPLNISSNPSGAEAVGVMKRLLASARAGKIPVVWTQVLYSQPDMSDAGLFWHKTKSLSVWQKGDTRGFDKSVEGLEPAEGEVVIQKKYPSAFFGTTLATDLQLRNVDTLVICGVSTSGCVRASTLDAMCHGFRPMVVGSGCGDRTDEIQNANLFDLNAKYADVVSAEEAIERMSQGWGN